MFLNDYSIKSYWTRSSNFLKLFLIFFEISPGQEVDESAGIA